MSFTILAGINKLQRSPSLQILYDLNDKKNQTKPNPKNQFLKQPVSKCKETNFRAFLVGTLNQKVLKTKTSKQATDHGK